MKKALTVLIAILILLIFAACEFGPSQNDGEHKPLDLTGSWVQSNGDSDSYQAGYISEDRIEIFWISDGGSTSSLYWSGSYDAPTEAVESYVWTSKNDFSRTRNALLASADEGKDISYENGKLTYSASMMGTTTTITLVPTETDYTFLGGAYAEVDASAEKLPVELADSGYTVYQSKKYTNISYAVELKNPNDDYAVEYPTIRITARDADDHVLSNEEQTLMAIAAGDTLFYGNTVRYEGQAPERVDISVVSGTNDYNFALQQGSDVLYTRDLQISNPLLLTQSNRRSFTGEVTNQSTIDLSTCAITVVYKMGDAIVGGTTGYVDDIQSGDTVPFEINDYDKLPSDYFDGYELFALQW